MRINVKEPGSDATIDLDLELVERDHRTIWSVKLPNGKIVLFNLLADKWQIQYDEKINDDLANAIGKIIDLLSVHDKAGKDLDKRFRIKVRSERSVL